AEVHEVEAPGTRRRQDAVVPGARGSRTRHGPRRPRQAWMRIFFATDIHGSEVCWRKFLNAGKFHKADVLVMGGDMTGKAMVPIVARANDWRLTLQDQEHILSTEDKVRAMEKRILDRG